MEDIDTKFFQFHSFSILSPPILLQPSNPQIREYFNQRGSKCIGRFATPFSRPSTYPVEVRDSPRLDSTRNRERHTAGSQVAAIDRWRQGARDSLFGPNRVYTAFLFRGLQLNYTTMSIYNARQR